MIAFTVGLLLIILCIFSSRNKKIPSNESDYLISNVYKKIADNIRSKEDYNALVRKIKNVEKRMKFTSSEKRYFKDCDLLTVLQKAEGIAANKALGWQLIVMDSIDVPLKILNHAFNVYIPGDNAIDHRALKLDGISWWLKIDSFRKPLKKPKWLPALRAFRTIIESTDSISKKVAGIDMLYTDMRPLFRNIFEPTFPLSAGQEWVALSFIAEGIPLARELVLEGAFTMKDILNIDIAKLKKHAGIGPKKIKKFLEYRERILGNHSDDFHHCIGKPGEFFG